MERKKEARIILISNIKTGQTHTCTHSHREIHEF
jgi:hypothetical protein